MSLKQIKEILSSRGLEIPDDQIKAKVTELGYKLTGITEDQVIAVINSLSTNILATKSVTKLQKTQSDKVQETKKGFNNKLKQELTKDLEAILEPIERYADQYESDAANQAFERLADIPVNTIKKIADLSQGYESNPEFFRQTSEQFCQALFTD